MRAIGLPVTTLALRSKKRGFCSELATSGGGVRPCTRMSFDVGLRRLSPTYELRAEVRRSGAESAQPNEFAHRRHGMLRFEDSAQPTKKRGFCSELATSAAGVRPYTRRVGWC